MKFNLISIATVVLFFLSGNSIKIIRSVSQLFRSGCDDFRSKRFYEFVSNHKVANNSLKINEPSTMCARVKRITFHTRMKQFSKCYSNGNLEHF